eukprot:g83354.t1
MPLHTQIPPGPCSDMLDMGTIWVLFVLRVGPWDYDDDFGCDFSLRDVCTMDFRSFTTATPRQETFFPMLLILLVSASDTPTADLLRQRRGICLPTVYYGDC